MGLSDSLHVLVPSLPTPLATRSNSNSKAAQNAPSPPPLRPYKRLRKTQCDQARCRDRDRRGARGRRLWLRERHRVGRRFSSDRKRTCGAGGVCSCSETYFFMTNWLSTLSFHLDCTDSATGGSPSGVGTCGAAQTISSATKGENAHVRQQLSSPDIQLAERAHPAEPPTGMGSCICRGSIFPTWGCLVSIPHLHPPSPSPSIRRDGGVSEHFVTKQFVRNGKRYWPQFLRPGIVLLLSSPPVACFCPAVLYIRSHACKPCVLLLLS